jgi:Tol biopolymer transport system component
MDNLIKLKRIKLLISLVALFVLFQVYKIISVRIANMDLPKGKIVFSSDIDGDDEIYTMNINGIDLKQLTRNLATDTNTATDDQPSFSADGRKIVFISRRQGQNTELIYDYRGRIIGTGSLETGTSDIYVMDLDGKNQIPLTYQGLNSCPFFSPDGKKIIFKSNRPLSLRIVDINTLEQRVLNAKGGQIRFSSDGKKVFDNFQQDLSVTDIDGANGLKLTHFNDYGEVKSGKKNHAGILFNLSPNGDKLVFIIEEAWKEGRINSINSYQNMFKVYEIGTDGSGLNEIYKLRTGNFSSMSEFRYSPKEDSIIFIDNFDTCGIYLLDLVKKLVVNLIDKKDNWKEVLNFTFTPDGRRIVFVANIYPENYYFHAVVFRNIRAWLNYSLFRKLTPLYDNKYLCIMDIDGRNYRRIVRLPQGTELGRDFIYWE